MPRKSRISTPRNVAEYKALEKRAGELVSRWENSKEEAELRAMADAMGAYETMARLAPLLDRRHSQWHRQSVLLRASFFPHALERLGFRIILFLIHELARISCCASSSVPRLRLQSSTWERFRTAPFAGVVSPGTVIPAVGLRDLGGISQMNSTRRQISKSPRHQAAIDKLKAEHDREVARPRRR